MQTTLTHMSRSNEKMSNLDLSQECKAGSTFKNQLISVIRNYSSVSGYKVNAQKSIASLHTS